MIEAKNKKIAPFLIWAFLIAWVLQFLASYFFYKNNGMLYSLLLSVLMFAPLIATIITGKHWKQVGWRPRVKGNIPNILIAWFAPALIGILGALVYYAVFPAAFDGNCSAFVAQIGEKGVEQLKASGIDIKSYVTINVFVAVTWAAWFNMFFAVGEEAGWRGYMYPILKGRFGSVKGRIIGGAIWGVWHWPIMVLVGYEYGTKYWGAPFTSPLLFCVICIAMGICLDELYERSSCIWVPALAHGAINAFASIPAIFLKEEYADQTLLGPLMIGAIGGLPLILLAVYILFKKNKKKSKDNSKKK